MLPDFIRPIENLKPGSHLCCIYETEEEHQAVLTSFLRHGLELGEKLLYIVDANTAQVILGYLQDDGLNAESYITSGQLSILSAKDAYMRNRVFDPDEMITLLRAEAERAQAEGYSALRVTGEMSWALQGLPGSERLIEYEAKLNQFFPSSKCLAICQYDRRRFTPELLLDVLTTHPIAVVGTQVYDNFYYMPPAEFLGSDLPAAKLRHWVDNLAEHKRAEEQIIHAKQEWERTFDAVPDLIMILDNEYRVVRVNKAMVERLGCTPKDLVGQICYDAFHGTEKPAALCPHARLMADGLAHSAEVHEDRLGGDFLVSVNPLHDPDGKLTGSVHVARDITERKQAEEALRKAHDELEQRVKKRTAELSKSNVLLKQEITDRKRTEEGLRQDEARLEALLSLSQISDASPNEIAGFALDQGIKLTGSRIGFLGFLSEDESVYSLHAVSKNVIQECKVAGNPVQWHVSEAGIWADAIKQRETLFVEDYAKPHPTKKGLPEGHFPIQRLMVVPVFEGNKIVAVAGVGNKPLDYDKADERQLTLLMNGMWHYTQRKQTEEALHRSEAELRLLSSQLLTAQEKERKSLAQELHDSIGQTLAAINFGTENALKRLPKRVSREIRQPLNAIIAMAQNAIEEIRRIQVDLRPPILDDLGILATINWFCREFQTIYSGIRIEKQITIQEDEVPDPLKIIIYRVLQEALNNVAKHSEADLVRLSLGKTRNRIEMAIEDNGLGFDLDDVLSVESPKRGLGLASMKERTELSGGSFSIESKKGAGTTVRASWPLQ